MFFVIWINIKKSTPYRRGESIFRQNEEQPKDS